MLQFNQPKTKQEADAIANQLQGAMVGLAQATKIIRHSVSPLITSPIQLRPNFPCEGPPVPRFAEVFWDTAFRDRIYADKKGGKTHRQMSLDILPESIPQIDCYVWQRQLQGDLSSTIKNLTSDIEIPAGGDISTTLNTAEEQVRERLIDAFKQANDRVGGGDAIRYLLSKAINFQGAWEVIQALWNLLVNKRIKIHIEIPTSIAGYETDSYIVDAFNKQFSTDAEIAVDNLTWHAW